MNSNVAETKGQAEATNRTVQPLVVRAGGQQWVIAREPLETMADNGQHSPDQDGAPELDEEGLPGAARHSLDWLERIRDYVHSNVAVVYEKLVTSLDLLVQHEFPKPKVVGSQSRAWALASVRRFRDSFQSGIIIGLVLGCLSLVLFHQMNSGSRASVVTQPGTSVTIPNYRSLTVTVPAGHLYALQAGNYSSQAAAQATQLRLSKLGVPTVIHQGTGPGQAANTYTLVAGVAFYSQDLNSLTSRLAILGIKSQAVPYTWNARQVSLNSWAVSKNLSDSITRWLSAEVSALNTLTAFAADGGVQQDATTAYQYSQSIQPPVQNLQGFSQGKSLLQLSSATKQAFAALGAGNKQQADIWAAQAYEDIQSLPN